MIAIVSLSCEESEENEREKGLGGTGKECKTCPGPDSSPSDPAPDTSVPSSISYKRLC